MRVSMLVEPHPQRPPNKERAPTLPTLAILDPDADCLAIGLFSRGYLVCVLVSNHHITPAYPMPCPPDPSTKLLSCAGLRGFTCAGSSNRTLHRPARRALSLHFLTACNKRVPWAVVVVGLCFASVPVVSLLPDQLENLSPSTSKDPTIYCSTEIPLPLRP